MYLTKIELAKHFRISVSTINNYMKQGMPFVKGVKSVRFKVEEVEQWLENKEK